MNNNDRRKQFQDIKTLCNAKTVLKRFGAFHRFYGFYTTLSRVRQLLCERRIWLTRLDSSKFDDTIEHKKYGCDTEQKKTFIKCFSYGIQESAAMWGLYCPPTYQAIRVVMPSAALKAMTGSLLYKVEAGKCTGVQLSKKNAFVSDIVYAAVKNNDEQRERANSLFWNGWYVNQKLGDLEDHKKKQTVTGFVKDAEWRFENETRLFVRFHDICGDEHIALETPKEMIANITFTLSPWADDEELRFTKDLLVKWMRLAGREVSSEDTKVFSKSVLSDGLNRWKENRGL